MLNIVFKSLEPSSLAREIAEERIGEVVKSFPDLDIHDMTLTLAISRSFSQRGADTFIAQLQVIGPKYLKISVSKRSRSLFIALDELCEALRNSLQRLQGLGDSPNPIKRRDEKEFLI